MSTKLSNKIMSGGLPFTFDSKDFDGSKPFAILSVRDPFYGEGLSITCQTQEDFLNGWTRTVNLTQGERHTWSGKYLFHADGEPAVKFYNGSSGWFQNGAVHNSNGPAITFGDTEVFCLNGHILDKDFFTYYVAYMENLRGKKHPTGLVPIFPHKTEVVEAYNLGLTLYFDTDMNYYWYNQSGELHHPTLPAVEKSDGTLIWYKLGEKIRESNLTMPSDGRMGTAQKHLDEIRAAVEKALDEALSPSFSKVSDVLNSSDWDELSVLFRNAGRSIFNGDVFEDVYDDFVKDYGIDLFVRDFSSDVREDFKSFLEDVLESPQMSEWRESIDELAGSVFNRKKVDTIKAEKPLTPDEVKILDSTEDNSRDLFTFTGNSLTETLDAFVEAAKKLERAATEMSSVDQSIASKKALDYFERDKGFVKYGDPEDITLIKTPQAGVETVLLPSSDTLKITTPASGDGVGIQGTSGNGLNLSVAGSTRVYLQGSTGIVGATGAYWKSIPGITQSVGLIQQNDGTEKQKDILGISPANDFDSEPKTDSSWGVPLGMLALAGVVGLFGQKKNLIKVPTQVEKVVEEAVEATVSK